MLVTVDFSEIEQKPERYVPVDVRSPSEYMEDTIAGAVNVPLFSDAERAHVGTVYKREGKAPAVRLGIEYVSKNLPQIYAQLESLMQRQKKLLIFCARGGMRSGAVSNFASSVGLPVTRLRDGYKGYRRHISERLPALIADHDFITLYGKTGSGKTHILHQLEAMGHSVLDLEGCANHRGSLLGAVGLGAQFSQKKFETNLYNSLLNAKDKIVFTEGESKRIGNVYLPSQIYDKMCTGYKVLVEAELELRRKVISHDYISSDFNKEEAIEAINKLVRYIGKERIKEYTSMITDGDYDHVIEELMIKYYDIVYNTNHQQFDTTIQCASLQQAADDIAQYKSAICRSHQPL